MKNFQTIVCVLLLTIIGGACAVNPATTTSTNTENSSENKTIANTTTETSKNSIDWQGVYVGTTPCENCEATQMVIQLRKNNTFVLEKSFKGKPEVTKQNGTFEWNSSETMVKFIPADNSAISYYLVGENQLVPLDPNGKLVSGVEAKKYLLKKNQVEITEKYWKLIELNGKAITKTNENSREAFLVFKAFENKLNGNTGCNNLMGKYELLEGNRIQFSGIATTRMACLDETYSETEFLKVLEMVDNFSILNDTLSFSKARMAPMAKFKAEELK